MSDLERVIQDIAKDSAFAGVVRVDRDDHIEYAKAFGMAHRGYGIANTVDTRFGTASATKALTALAVVSLIERGVLDLTTTARSVLGTDLPLIDDAVTVEHLLGHRSGIGDYLDEGDEGYDVAEYVMPVPAHELATAEQYLGWLDGHPMKFAPGERFAYCNGGYVVLALIAERASGTPYHELVTSSVCEPAGMHDTAFFRSDELPGRTALGYVDVAGTWRTNVFHLPVRGVGDGGAYSTVADMSAFWRALFAGNIVSREWVAEMVRPHSDVPEESMRYGLGFWLHATNDTVILLGEDAGVSFYSAHSRSSGHTQTVISNTAEGAWPIVKALNSSPAPREFQ
jgi:CubicO group peptidase (beta-lactamase class C family)